METLLKDIRDNNILLEVVDGKLQVFTSETQINPALINAIRERKEELIQFLLNSDQSGFTDSFKLNIPAVQEQSSYPLSSAQRRLWVLSQTSKGSIAYNMHSVYVLEGNLNHDAFAAAFKSLLERHESLRTVIKEDEQKEIKQFILSSEQIDFNVQYVDMRNETAQEEMLKNKVQQEQIKPFDLTTGPLLRAVLFQVADNKWVFSYVMHHIISDGWSMGILINELLTLYHAHANHTANTLPPLRIQYKDYAAWQQEQLTGNGLKNQKAYWLRQFSGNLPVLDLAGDKVRPAVKTYNGGIITRKINAALLNAVKEMSRKQGATLFTALLAAVNALLYKYTHQEDIIIGSPIAGRDHMDLENQIGFYVNMLALRTSFNGGDNFTELFENTKQVTLQAFENQAYPFDELVTAANLGKDISRHALFDVVVVLQNTSTGSNLNGVKKVDDITVSSYAGTERVVSIFDLRFDFKETGDELDVKIDYNNDIYNKETAERLGDHFVQLLTAAINNPGVPLNALNYLSETECHQLLEEFNDTAVDYPATTTIIDLFESQVKETPGNTAIAFEETTLTYEELNNRANQIAHFLMNEVQLQKEDGVGILLNRQPDCIAAMLGILKAGGMYIPFETDTPEERLDFMVKDTGIKTMISEKAFIETLNRLQWSNECLGSYLCVDSMNVYTEKEQVENVMMSQELWDHFGSVAVDQISGGGWISSFTGQSIAAEEMEEYAMNAYKKLSGSLHKEMRVLEIGCSSGLTLSKIAPDVALFYGTDLSPVIIDNTRALIASKGFTNVKLKTLAAHEITTLDEKDFDLIIINSVIQHFHGHNYLRSVIKDAISLLKDNGRIFIGDVMDIERKEALVSELEAFKAANKGKGYNTKTDFSADLFVAKGFFEDLTIDESEIKAVDIQEKIYTIENELTKYRYDVILEISKKGHEVRTHTRNKYQFSNEVLLKQPLNNPTLQISPDNLAYLIYTSGTTGRPKGVMVQHNNVVRLFKTNKPLFDFNAGDVWTMFHSYCFDFSVWEIYGALFFGGKLVVVPKSIAQDTKAFVELLQHEKVTILNQTPSAFYNLIKQEAENDIPGLQLRYVIFGGEALSPGRLNTWKERYDGTKLINMYGITETTVHVTYKEITTREIENNISNIGRPIPTLSCYVLDQQQQLVPVGVPGELYVGGAGVARGYLNRPELTSQRFIASPFRNGERLYRSGDKVRILENGEMEYMGRVDDQVKIRGYRIELGEIKNVLDSHALISEAIVIAKEDMQGDKNLVAYIVSKERLTITDVRSYLAEKLPEYMVPAYYVEMESLPLTVNGKVDKKALPAPEEMGMSSGIKYEAPQTGLESRLVNIFSNVLNIGKDVIGVNDNFFSLGGDSIKAMRLVVQIKQQLSLGITIGKLYEYQTIRELARWLIDGTEEESVYKNLDKGLKKIERVKELIENENLLENRLPLSYEEIYPVSQVEQGMIYSSMFNTVDPVYYDQFVFFIKVDDFNKFKQGIATLVLRHPILRTRFYMKSFSQPVKAVLREVALPVTYEDLSMLTNEAKKAAITAYLKDDLSIRLDFDNELLWKFKIFQLGGGEYSAIWSFHHAALDGWSISIFCKELADLLAGGSPADLPVLKYSYKDYCAILLGREKSKLPDSYWKTLLDGYTRNKLPFNYKGLKVGSETGMKHVSRTVNGDLLSKLTSLAAHHQLSFKAICLAAHVYLLHIICAEQDVITGVVTHDRPEIENSEYILGCFLNTIPIRVDFDKLSDILSLLKTVNKYLTTVKSYEVHLSEIAKIIGEKSSSANPVFDTILNFTDFHLYKELDTSAVRAVDPALDTADISTNQMTNTLFDVEIDKTRDRLFINIKYTPAYFNESDVQYALALYVRILESIAKDVSTPVTALNLLTPPEAKEVLFDFNDTIADYAREKTLHMLLEEMVEKTPDGIALRQDGIDMTYRTLNNRANQLAAHLIAQGIQPGDNVGLLVSRSFEMIIGMYGILKAGGAYVPIDPEYPTDRQEYIVRNSGVTKVITDAHYPLSEQLTDVAFTIIDEKQLSACSTENPGLQIDPKQLAYTIYTSGSTGRPKGVMIAHHSVINLLEWVNEEFNVGTADRLLFITSMCFDLSVYDIFGILSVGGTLVIARQSEVQNVTKLKSLLLNERITFWDSVPTTMNYLVGELDVENDGYLQHDLRIVFMSGDWIPVQLPDRIRKYFPQTKVISLGGATEGTVWSNYYPIDKVGASWSSIPYGRPIKNNFFYILDNQLQPVPKGVVGELFIGGTGVAEGYANDKDKTAFSFRQDPFNNKLGGRMYKTGDLGRFMPDGNMEFLGRKDNQVKIRGFRVELGEIESILSKHDKIKEAIVDVNKDASNNNQLCGYLVLSEPVNIQEIKDYLRGAVPSYMIPNQYVLLESLPLNSNGKINRKALPQPAQDGNDRLTEYIAPATRLEMNIAAIWKSILSIERISMRDDVFDLGANSLSVGAFVNRIHKETNLTLSIPEVFLNPTIEGMAGILAHKNSGTFEGIQPVEASQFYPLSSAQQQLWVLNQFEEGNLSYHIPGVFMFEGNLDTAAFSASFNALLERHEILRTVFMENEDGEIKQFILSPAETGFIVAYRDFRHIDQQEEMIRKAVQQEFVQSFDLTTGPLLRANLFQIENNKWVFIYTMHHIISDGWSIGILMNELLVLYNAFIKGVPHTLRPLRIQYKDYAAWQQQQLTSSASAIDRDYWLKQLEGELPVLELTGDKPRPPMKTFNGSTLHKMLNPALTAGLKAIGQEQGATLFMSLLAMVNTLLYKYTHQEDIIIGSPAAGRDHADLEDQIGFYVNTLALRTRFSGDNSYRELLENTKEVMLGAYAHQSYPFDELIHDLNIQRDISRGTLFDVMVILQNNNISYNRQPVNMGDLKVSAHEGGNNVNSKFDLVFDFIESGEEICARIEYNTDLYSKTSIERLAYHFEQLVSAVITQPGVSLNQLDYLGRAERNQMLHAFNDTRTAYPSNSTIIELFEEQVIQTPDAIALIFEDKSYTYQELNEQANQLGHYLRNNYDVTADDLIGIQLDRSAAMAIAILGVLKSGAGCVPVDIELPQERINYILINSNCKAVITSNELTAVSSYGKENLPSVNSSVDLAYVIYTSGSTGVPKGCMLENKGIINHLYSKIDQLGLNRESVICHNSALHFVGGIWQLLAPLVTGGKVVLCNNEELRNIEKLIQSANTHHAAVLEVIPSQLNEYLSYTPTIQFGCVKTLILTGERLNTHFVNKCYQGNEDLEIINTYGQTEFSDVTSSYCIPRHNDRQNVLIGSPVQNTKMFVLSPGGALCPIGVVGEICTSGDGLCRGYLNQPELTAEKFVANPFLKRSRMFKTGDLGRWLADGSLEVIGRKDDQVKIRGYRIELHEIENALLAHDEIEEAVVLSVENNLVAFIIGKTALKVSELRAWLGKKLPNYMLPAYYKQLDKMPQLANGKTNKKALRTMIDASMSSGVEYVAPRNETESKLVKIWEEILQRDKIGVNDNFFDLGGHSLKATTMANKIKHVFKVNVTLKEIFKTPEIEKISEEIQKKKWLYESKKADVKLTEEREVIRL